MAEAQIKMLLYGRNRAGKTTLACTFPKPLLLVAVEDAETGGAESVRNVPGVTVLRLEDADDVQQLGIELSEKCEYRTVVLDSGTSLEALVLAQICGWKEPATMLKWGMVGREQYMQRSDKMRKLLRPFLRLPCHFVLTCNEKDHARQEGAKQPVSGDAQSESYFAAAMSTGTVIWAQDSCDYICQLYMDREVITEQVELIKNQPPETVERPTGKYVRRLRTAYHPNFAAGARSAAVLPDYLENPSYAKIAAMIKGEKK